MHACKCKGSVRCYGPRVTGGFEPCDMNSRNQMLVLFNSPTIVEPSLQLIDNGLLVNNVKYLKVDYKIICSVNRLQVSNKTCSIRNSMSCTGSLKVTRDPSDM